jgi:hypothetical protein
LADPIRKPLVAGKEKIAESRLTIEDTAAALGLEG